jgi:hypothetical protein
MLILLLFAQKNSRFPESLDPLNGANGQICSEARNAAPTRPGAQRTGPLPSENLPHP